MVLFEGERPMHLYSSYSKIKVLFHLFLSSIQFLKWKKIIYFASRIWILIWWMHILKALSRMLDFWLGGIWNKLCDVYSFLYQTACSMSWLQHRSPLCVQGTHNLTSSTWPPGNHVPLKQGMLYVIWQQDTKSEIMDYSAF